MTQDSDLATRHRTIAQSFFAAVDRLDRPALNLMYHDEFSLEFVGNDKLLDREAHWGLMNGYHQAFPDMIHRPDIIVADAERAVVRGTITGTNEGPLMGQPPTGRFVEVQFMTMITFRDEKILALFTLMDVTKLSQQLGTTNVVHRSNT